MPNTIGFSVEAFQEHFHRFCSPTNSPLAALPPNEYAALAPKLENFELIFNENIYKPGGEIEHLYFPERGIISLLSQVDAKSAIEVGIVGIKHEYETAAG